MTARVVRAFAFGFSIILLAIHLQSRSLNSPAVGAVIAVGLVSASLTGLAAAAAANRFGRRVTLAAIGVGMCMTGLDIALAHPFWLLILSGLTGMLGASGTDLGPFLVVEQAVLTQAAQPAGRNRAFARYSLTGALAAALGGLAASAGTTLMRTEAFFILFAILGLATAAIPLLLSSHVESVDERSEPAFGSLRPIIGLASLFALDSLGNGLVVNSVLVYWLHIRFGASSTVLGPAFAAMSILGALSFEASGRLADRIGLINTMVFTHVPSQILLVVVPFMPGLGWALLVLLLRSLVVQMDQPARQAYVVSIVKPSERSGALAITGTLRGLASTAGPVITGVAIQAAALGIPFFLGGSLKFLYDIGLYVGFRRRPGGHETIHRKAPQQD